MSGDAVIRLRLVGVEAGAERCDGCPLLVGVGLDEYICRAFGNAQLTAHAFGCVRLPECRAAEEHAPACLCAHCRSVRGEVPTPTTCHACDRYTAIDWCSAMRSYVDPTQPPPSDCPCLTHQLRSAVDSAREWMTDLRRLAEAVLALDPHDTAMTSGPWEVERIDWMLMIVRAGARGPGRRLAHVGGSSALGHNGGADAAGIVALRNALGDLLALARQAVEASHG